MTKIVCGSIECIHNTDKHTCSAKALKLVSNSVHTIWDGRKEFWICNQYEVSEDYKKTKEKLDEFLRGKL